MRVQVPPPAPLFPILLAPEVDNEAVIVEAQHQSLRRGRLHSIAGGDAELTPGYACAAQSGRGAARFRASLHAASDKSSFQHQPGAERTQALGYIRPRSISKRAIWKCHSAMA